MTARFSETISVLETAWDAVREVVPELPPARIVVSHNGPPATRGEVPTEIFVPEALLDWGARPVLGAVAHEAAHVLAEVRGSFDTSRRGRYHNQVFVANVQELGFNVFDSPAHQDAFVWLVNDPHRRYERVLSDLGNILPLPPVIEIDMDPANYPVLKCRPQRIVQPGQAGKPASCLCDPPRRFKIFPGRLALGPIRCEICGEEFLYRTEGTS